jgi:hypothetical protein
MSHRQCRGVDQPEKKYAGIQSVDQETRHHRANRILSIEWWEIAQLVPTEVHLLEKHIIYTHQHQKTTPTIRYLITEMKDSTYHLGEHITKDDEDKVTHPYTGNERETSRMSIIDTLLDDCEYHRTNR